MNDRKIKKLVTAAMLAALVCVATIVIQIPSLNQGYLNLGDCFVLLSGWLLGPWLDACRYYYWLFNLRARDARH